MDTRRHCNARMKRVAVPVILIAAILSGGLLLEPYAHQKAICGAYLTGKRKIWGKWLHPESIAGLRLTDVSDCSSTARVPIVP
jgi:hypothetical protein